LLAFSVEVEYSTFLGGTAMQTEDLLGKEDWAVIESLLPEGWEEKCKELKAYRLNRAFDGPGDLLRTLLIHCAQGHSFRVTAAIAQEGGVATLSDVALNKRLRLSSDWLRWLSNGVAQKWFPRTDAEDCAGLCVKVADATTVQEPGSKGTSWRIHYSLELSSLRCTEITITEKEKGESFKNVTVQEGDLWIGDRMYAKAPGIDHVLSHGGDVLVRAGWNSLQLCDEQGQKFDLLGHLRRLRLHDAGDWPVFIAHDRGFIAGRICAVRKSVLAANRERKRILRESSKKGRKTKPETLAAAGYTFVFTTLDQSIPAETVLAIYSTRWQIELTFKRLKSLLGLGHLHNKNPESAKAWLYGKLLAACLIEALAVVSERFFPWGYPLAKTTPLREKHLEGDRPHVPIPATSHNAHEQPALTT
jgi:transposase